MHYLCASLERDTASHIVNLKVSTDSFASAWDLLTSRYENKRLLKTSQFTKLRSLIKMKTKSAKVLNSIFTTVSEWFNALNSLGSPAKHWDNLLLHDVVQLLDIRTHEAWKIRLGSTTDYPSHSN